MLLEDLDDYKNTLMEELCKDKDIVWLLTKNSKAKVPNYNLPYTQIFPYEYVPETVDEAKSFICFDVDAVKVPNKTFYFPYIYIWEFTHISNMRMPEGGGIRIDRIASSIDKILNGSRIYGMGELELKKVTRFSPSNDYLGRVLVYATKEWNRTSLNQKKGRSNRKSL